MKASKFSEVQKASALKRGQLAYDMLVAESNLTGIGD